MQYSDDSEIWVTRKHPESWVHVMQYTGLKDKNGKEIYEGDIVSGTKFVAGKEKPMRAQVTYQTSTRIFQSFFGLKELETEKWLGDCLTADMEVVGNIYENPELLK